MRCPSCNEQDWMNVDQYKLKPDGMELCKSCGFVSYPSLWKSEEEIREFYRTDYRKAPTINNWFTGQRKLHFHNAFLGPVFKKWKDSGVTSPVIGEIGSAYGLFLKFVRDHFPSADLNGVELTTSYRRVAKEEFGITLNEDLDQSKKYDMIATYKVLEHQCDPDKRLAEYFDCLKDDGLLYISVPIWFGRLNCFGLSEFSLSDYYHPNHINTWTEKIFESILERAGFKWVQKNKAMYDNTYLCIKDASLKDRPVFKEDHDKMIERLARIEGAGKAYVEGRFADAFRLWPDFPQAYINYYETNRRELHAGGWDGIKEKLIEPAMKACPDSADILGLAGDICRRYGRFQQAIGYFERAIELKPGNAAAIKGIIYCLSAIGKENLVKTRFDEGLAYIRKARDVARHLRMVSASDEYEATNLIFEFDALLPMENETKR